MLKSEKKCWHHLSKAEAIIFQGNVKKAPKRWKSMKIADIEGELLHISWTTWGISRKFSRKIWLMIQLKVTKKQGFHFSFKRYIFQKTTEGIQLTPPAVLVLIYRNLLNALSAKRIYFHLLTVASYCAHEIT